MPPRTNILATASTPSFDVDTGQLSTTTHHLLSSARSYSSSFPSHSLLLTAAPSSPYQSTITEAGKEERSRKRKRRKSDHGETGTSWEISRLRTAEKVARDPRRAAVEGAARKFAETVEVRLEDAFLAVGEAVGEDGDWEGETEGVRWDEGEREGVEIDWVGIGIGVHDTKEELSLDKVEGMMRVEDLMNRIILNDSPTTIIQRIEFPFVLPLDDSLPSSPSTPLVEAITAQKEASLVLPPRSGFLLSDFSTWSTGFGLREIGLKRGGWDALLLDPPWPNASATRSAEYTTFDAYDLFKLDIRSLLGDGPTLVAIWLTNKLKYRTLLLEKLLPGWGLEEVVEWYWIKITSKGEPVFPIHDSSRKPYEGYYDPLSLIPRGRKKELPKEKIFLSTPVGHSRKPVVLDLFRPFLPLTGDRPPNVLELFARTSLAGPLAITKDDVDVTTSEAEKEDGEQRGFWMSVGNEAVKFNMLQEDREGGCKGWLS